MYRERVFVAEELNTTYDKKNDNDVEVSMISRSPLVSFHFPAKFKPNRKDATTPRSQTLSSFINLPLLGTPVLHFFAFTQSRRNVANRTGFLCRPKTTVSVVSNTAKCLFFSTIPKLCVWD